MKPRKMLIFFLSFFLIIFLNSCNSSNKKEDASTSKKEKKKKTKKIEIKDRADKFLDVHLEHLKRISEEDSLIRIKIKEFYSKLDSLDWKIEKSKEDSVMIGFLNKRLDSLLILSKTKKGLMESRQRLISSKEFEDVYYFLRNPEMFYNLDSLRRANAFLKNKSREDEEKFLKEKEELELYLFKKKMESLNKKFEDLKKDSKESAFESRDGFDNFDNTIEMELSRILEKQKNILEKIRG